MTATEETVLERSDPLYAFLRDEVLRRALGLPDPEPDFCVRPLDGNNGVVFRFHDRRTCVNLAGKFYGRKWICGSQTGNDDLRRQLMLDEFDNLTLLRRIGFDSFPHHVVRPLAVSEDCGCLLVEEFAPGVNLHHSIWLAFAHNCPEQLLDRVRDAGGCLADLHNRTRTGIELEPGSGVQYLTKVIGQLAHWNIIEADQRCRLENLRDRWQASGVLREGEQTLIHGDATPEHFLYSGDHDVTLIDGETAQLGDPAMDLGYLVGELKHLAVSYGDDSWAAEPYIQHFYSIYAGLLPDCAEDLATLTTRGRFYMGCCELRICRNAWIDMKHRRRLLGDAEACLSI